MGLKNVSKDDSRKVPFAPITLNDRWSMNYSGRGFVLQVSVHLEKQTLTTDWGGSREGILVVLLAYVANAATQMNTDDLNPRMSTMIW